MARLFFSIFLFVLLLVKESFSFRCDRRPYGATTQATPADGRFRLQVLGTDDKYLPEQLYTVQIARTDDQSVFTMFMISAEGDSMADPNNPRRTITLDAGEVSRIGATSKYKARCPNTVEQSNSAPKESVEVYWRAPISGSGCVTLRAMVAESEDLWFEDGAPLTKRICEDLSQPDDMSPIINEECSVCDEAKYEVSFTGIWSRNTHPELFPENDWKLKFSDLVGASHSTEYSYWSPGELASDGLKELAEYANSSKLEEEIREKVGDGVRTLIKGKGHQGAIKMQLPTYSFFRADKVNHLVSVTASLSPSPDWFLGVSRFELCTQDNTWLDERELNLYPWDAGTDNGISYESPNLPTYPQDSIDRVQMSSPDRNSPFFDTDMTDLHPFGKLHIKLIRTYKRTCEETTEEGETEPPGETSKEESGENPSEPDEPSRYQKDHTDRRGQAPPSRDPDTSEDCPMTQWSEWSSCEGPCEDGRIKGYKRRERYHMIGDKIVGKYDPDDPDAEDDSAVPEYCKENYDEFEREKCEEEDCEIHEDIKVDRRVMGNIIPVHGWRKYLLH